MGHILVYQGQSPVSAVCALCIVQCLLNVTVTGLQLDVADAEEVFEDQDEAERRE